MMLAFSALVACGGGGSGQSSDPTVTEYPIAYVKRPVPTNNNTPTSTDIRTPAAFNLGATLYIKRVATLNGSEIDVTSRVMQGVMINNQPGRVDVKDVEFSYDGTRVVFALIKEDTDPNDADPEFWNIYEYTVASDTLRRILTNNATADEGHDVSPNYLPDNRIIFSSTRHNTTQAILLAEGKGDISPAPETESRRGPAFNLHIMNSNGSDLRQVSFGANHDLYPSVMHTGTLNGKVLFTRWEHMGGDRHMHLYTMNPDGTNTQYLYGKQSHATGTTNDTIEFIKPRQAGDGRVLSLIRRYTGGNGAGNQIYDGGDIAAINVSDYVENTVPVASRAGLAGPAQSSASNNLASTLAGIALGGRFNAAIPLLDSTNRALVSYSSCFANVLDNGVMVVRPCNFPGLDLQAATTTQAPPRYGVWVYTMNTAAFTPVTLAVDGSYFTDIAVAQDRTTPRQILDTANLSVDTGILHVRSIYDLHGNFDSTYAPTFSNLTQVTSSTAEQRLARFVRIYKHAYMPQNVDNDVIGVSTNRLMREIIGYAPIDADGSVNVRVPADVPLSLAILDRNGREIGTRRHNSWFTIRPGETLTCNGCHAGTVNPHGRSDAEATALNTASMTQAQIRTSGNESELRAAINITYTDSTTPANSISYTYSGVTGLPTGVNAPVNFATCIDSSSWGAGCRITINYGQHIHPLWSAARTVGGACINCHTPTRVDINNNPIAPDGGLDLTTGPDANVATQHKAYRQLVPGRLTPGNALSSTTFFDRFATGGTHAGRLTTGELKLISEWTDIGAQYQNNPFYTSNPNQ